MEWVLEEPDRPVLPAETEKSNATELSQIVAGAYVSMNHVVTTRFQLALT